MERPRSTDIILRRTVALTTIAMLILCALVLLSQFFHPESHSLKRFVCSGTLNLAI